MQNDVDHNSDDSTPDISLALLTDTKKQITERQFKATNHKPLTCDGCC